MKESLIFAVAIVAVFSYITLDISNNIAKLNDRIDHLYTERGFNELKCKAAGGEYFNQYMAGLDQDGKFVSRTKQGCFRTSISKDEVEIKI